MINKEYKYSYNINPDTNEKLFVDTCMAIEKGLQGIDKEGLLMDVDGSLIQIYYYKGKKIAVYNDYYVGALYIDSNVKLDDILGKKSIY